MEYAHRMWGRAIGLVFAVPAAYFWGKGWVGKSLKPRLVLYTGLILFQVRGNSANEQWLLMDTVLSPPTLSFRVSWGGGWCAVG